MKGRHILQLRLIAREHPAPLVAVECSVHGGDDIKVPVGVFGVGYGAGALEIYIPRSGHGDDFPRVDIEHGYRRQILKPQSVGEGDAVVRKERAPEELCAGVRRAEKQLGISGEGEFALLFTAAGVFQLPAGLIDGEKIEKTDIEIRTRRLEHFAHRAVREAVVAVEKRTWLPARGGQTCAARVAEAAVMDITRMSSGYFCAYSSAMAGEASVEPSFTTISS